MDRLINDGPRIQEWMVERTGMRVQKEFHGIAREIDGTIIAAFGYDTFDSWNCALHVCADSPRGFNRRLLRIGFWVPFVQWHYSALLGIIQGSNSKSLRFAAHLGFSEFAAVTDSGSNNGLKFFIMRRHTCRWISPAERRNE